MMQLPGVTIRQHLIVGLQALLGILTEVEVQAVHAASNSSGRQLLKEFLGAYQTQIEKAR